MSRWLRRVGAALLISASIVAVTKTLHPWVGMTFAIVTTNFLIVGLLIMERRPTNRVGPVVALVGLVIGLYSILDAWIRLAGPSGGAVLAATIVSLSDGPTFFLFTLLFLLFPDGHLPSPRWRRLLVVAGALAVWVFLGALLKPGPFSYYAEFENPLHPPMTIVSQTWELAYAALVGCVVAAALSLVGRWRRGGALERAQLKWAAAAAVLMAVAMVTYGGAAGPGQATELGDFSIGLALGLFPIAIGVAVLRYRLFEIDRLISRTIGWAIVTATLVAVFAVLVIGLQAILNNVTQGQTLAVAASTLVAFALFQPVRRRVQRAVDHRFDRARYDAQHTTDAFAERLRDEIDIDTVAGDLTATAQQTLAPSLLGVWLRAERP